MSGQLPNGQLPVEGVLFDLDGVLGKLTVLVKTAIALASDFGGELSEEEFRRDFAAGRISCLWRYVAAVLASQGRWVSWDVVRDREAVLYFGECDRPGLVMQEELLINRRVVERVAARFPIGIVTSRPRDRTAAFLERVALPAALFRVIVTRDDVGDRFIKPHRLPVELGIAGLKPRAGGRVIFLDDGPGGMVAGQGLTFTVGIADPEYRTPQSLHDAGAHAVWRHPDELARHLAISLEEVP